MSLTRRQFIAGLTEGAAAVAVEQEMKARVQEAVARGDIALVLACPEPVRRMVDDRRHRPPDVPRIPG